MALGGLPVPQHILYTFFLYLHNTFVKYESIMEKVKLLFDLRCEFVLINSHALTNKLLL